MTEHTDTETLLVRLLIDEYGEDEATWRELGSSRRIAAALAARVDAARRDADAQIAAIRALADEWQEHGKRGTEAYPDEPPVMLWTAAASRLRSALAVSDPTQPQEAKRGRGPTTSGYLPPGSTIDDPNLGTGSVTS